MWIQTYTGKQFWPLCPSADDVCIEDIAHALSLTCRFTGHCREFYSVAQHSVLVAQHIARRGLCYCASPEYQNYVQAIALLHDAAEAYIADTARPIKEAIGVKGYEHAIMRCVLAHFRLAVERDIACTVKYEDDTALATEARDLMGPPPAPWTELPAPWPETIHPWSPLVAEREFLEAATAYGIHGRAAMEREAEQ